jgi:hypothetical protein
MNAESKRVLFEVGSRSGRLADEVGVAEKRRKFGATSSSR